MTQSSSPGSLKPEELSRPESTSPAPAPQGGAGPGFSQWFSAPRFTVDWGVQGRAFSNSGWKGGRRIRHRSGASLSWPRRAGRVISRGGGRALAPPSRLPSLPAPTFFSRGPHAPPWALLSSGAGLWAAQVNEEGAAGGCPPLRVAAVPSPSQQLPVRAGGRGECDGGPSPLSDPAQSSLP